MSDKSLMQRVVLCTTALLLLSALAYGQVTIAVTPQSGTTMTVGSAYVWRVTTTNTGGSAMTVGNNYFIIFPDGTRKQVPPRAAVRNVNAGASFSITQATTTSVYTTQTGIFTFEAQAVDSAGTVLATGSTTFVLLPLPAGLVPPRFVDIAPAAGVNAVHHNDPTACMDMIGTGAGWADYDGDGMLDLFASDYNGPSHLYRNNGDLSFTEMTAAAGIPAITRATGVSWADYDNDGDSDLLVLTYGSPMLYRNNANGTFSDVSVASGISVSTGRGTTAAWGDYDRDGWLDLYIVNRDECEPAGLKASDRLLHSDGDGTFTDATANLGGLGAAAVTGYGFSATWVDIDNDGDSDLYVVNDKGWANTPNVLWRNDGSNGAGGWIFTNISASSLANVKMAAMGVGVIDYNRDGWMDLIASNLGFNLLLRNNGTNVFSNVSQDAGFQRVAVDCCTSVTWGLGAWDFNNDSWEDVFIVAGEIANRDQQPNAVLVNNYNGHLTGVVNDGTFLDLTYASGASHNETKRTGAFADFDADGWVDVYVQPYYSKAGRLYRNEGPVDGNANNWVQIRLIGTNSNRDGVGARLTLTAGGETQYREIVSGTSLGAGSQIAGHFGLRTATEVSTLQIRWPSGLVQTLNALAANQRLVITEGSSTVATDPVPARIPTPGTIPPAAPTGLTATAVSSSQINLAWNDNAVGETGYRVYQSSDNLTFMQIADIAANSNAHSVTGLNASSTYYFYVVAYGTGGTSAASNTANTTTSAPAPAPGPPTDVTAMAVSSSAINVGWTDASTTEEGFKVYRSTDNVSYSLLATVGAGVSTYANTGLSAATLYYYKVSAFNSSGESALAGPASATTLAAPPDAMQISFGLTTASEAAVGAPIGYLVRMTNTDVITRKAQATVDLIAPDGTTTYNVWTSALQNYTPNTSRQRDSSFKSSDYTALAGAFQLRATLKNELGAILGQVTHPITIVAAPGSGAYGSVGGKGPPAHLLGSKYEYATVTANLTGASMTLKTKTTLILPDSSERALGATTATITGGGNSITKASVITSQYTNATGTFGVRVDVQDSGGNTLHSQTSNFVRNALPADYHPSTFTDMAATAGVNRLHVIDRLTTCMGTMVGAGVAVGDYDGDGWEDIFATNQSQRGALWHNNGDGSYTDMAVGAGIPFVLGAAGANFADIDNDDDPDLLILVQGGQNVLMRNNGNGTFTDTTAGSGLITPTNQTNIAATFGDYDKDGYLDLYVVVHMECGGTNKNDHLYHNNGNGTFTDVSHLMGGTTESAHGLAAVWYDYDLDGDVDLYVGQDIGGTFGPNKLWKNNGNGTFTDASAATKSDLKMSAMGIAVGDYNRDGRFDMYVSDQRDNELLRLEADGTFSSVEAEANADRTTIPVDTGTTSNVGWGTAFYDFNNDGWEDLYFSAGSMGSPRPLTDGFLLNNRDGSFLELSRLSGADHAGQSRCSAYADFNHDGFMDIFNAGLDEVPQLYINNGSTTDANPYNWLQVKLVGTMSNRDAVGARLVGTVGGVALHRQVINGGTFQSNSELAVHFGLGSAMQLDTLTIYWPSGAVTTLNNVLANQKLVITE